MSQRKSNSIELCNNALTECIHCFECIPNSKFIRHVRQCQSKRSCPDPDVDTHDHDTYDDNNNIPMDEELASPASQSHEIDDEELPDIEGPYSSSDSDSNSEDEDSLSGLFGDSYLESVMMERLQHLESSTAGGS
jgi:hypothetical protein